VVSYEERDDVVTVTTEQGFTVAAEACVLATNTPISQGLGVHAKQAPFRTFVLAARVPKGGAADILLWDTAQPYRYVRVQPGEQEDLLIVGGEDYKSGHHDDAAERFERLEAWARVRWPRMGEVVHRWSGQVYEPADRFPFIGRNPGDQNVFIVTGDSGEGLTTGVAASLILPDLVQGRENAWASVYDPSRTTLKASAVGDFLKENLDVAAKYVEHVTGGEVPSLEALEPGQGALVRLQGEKVAAYRDPDGELHLRSSVCTHMGCVVHFNSFERCWDCPCHGSQFAVDGTVLSGPATRPLEPAKAQQAAEADAEA
jgi:Rieske Fe-S protein